KDKEGKLMRKRNLTMVTMFGVLLAVLPASAATIATHTDGNARFRGFPGQSFTTPAGGPWNHITFNFLANDRTAQAAGTLYIFTSAFNGSPNDLSTSTPLAKSTGVTNGVYMFDPATVTLQPNITYYTYSDTFSASIQEDLSGSGGFGVTFQDEFFQGESDSLDFSVSGEVADLFVRTLGDISAALTSGGIDNQDIASSLTEKFTAAKNAPNKKTRDNIINAFINQVNAHAGNQAGKHSSTAAAALLLGDAIAMLGLP